MSTNPPLKLNNPSFKDRKREKSRLPRLSKEECKQNQIKGERFITSLESLSNKLSKLTESEKEGFLLKIKSDSPPKLTGTDLIIVSESPEGYVLAVPKEANLSKVIKKINDFNKAKPGKGKLLPNQSLVVKIENFEEAHPLDRLSPELRNNYEKYTKAKIVNCEIEIRTYENGKNKIPKALSDINDELKKEFTNDTGRIFEHEDNYCIRRLVIQCTGSVFKRLVENNHWQKRIIWFEERPQFETLSSIINNTKASDLGKFVPPSKDSSAICVIDTGISPGNIFLEPVVNKVLSKSFLSKSNNNPYDEHGHGSGVASLVSYYSLHIDKGATNEGKNWVISARILNDQNDLDDKEGRLFSKALEDIVKHYQKEGIKIFNLSVNMIDKLWNNEYKSLFDRKSWVARKIDELSNTYDVVFVVSAGNLSTPNATQLAKQGKKYPEYFKTDTLKILDPAQSSHAITVGTISGQMTVIAAPNKKTIAQENQIAPFSRCGPGIANQIKPELVEIGGNYVHELEDDCKISSNIGTSEIVASHQPSPMLVHGTGTSYSAARVSYKLGIIYNELQKLGVINPSSCLLKAFVTNCSDLPTNHSVLNGCTFEKADLLNMYGYGLPNHLLATATDDYSTILYFDGTIEPNKVAFFEIPIPSQLEDSGSEEKRLTITVVHNPEVQRWGLERYHGSDLKWRIFRGDISKDEVISAMSKDEEEGEVTSDSEESSNLPKGMDVKYGFNLRSRGTIQQDVIKWKKHKKEYSENHYTLAISSFKRWDRRIKNIPFAVVIRIDESSKKIPIYNFVKTEISNIRVKVKSH